MPATTATTKPADDQASLFTLTASDDAERVVSGVRFIAADPAASDAALIGDGYGWLAAALPAPRPPTCPACHRPTVLPAAAPVLWTCPRCHPTETR
ncbi:hypothetical protein [Nonomuraea aurantiaca]|uniref:hypothetical protein n=1 Tax=Nonomuraea aurantiaca TaxID=2878562 RepID=UPI001CD9DE41|nr:hypothetical protein [Nonomuraea aurantiaca]MCA2227401.1 hypothetical protein [Nonomuraea aurantiaca]